jgi:TfoX/Sxy family transcriptional regulator of competence genes
MDYYSEDEGRELREEFEERTLHWPKVTVRRMFGCPAYLADGKLFAFLVTDGVVITQIRKQERVAAASTFTTAPFKAGEREIERWVVVTLKDTQQLNRLMRLIRNSYETVLQN